ncbi:MAG: Arm DNA-binding domain-containing protein [Nevskia sp.]|nr:Arm DNA-binding domain-containing protein [Nevskia sp.]
MQLAGGRDDRWSLRLHPGEQMRSKLLSDIKCRTTRVHGKEQLLTDGDGLYLRVRPSGKDWLFIYSLNGRRRKMGVGPYPDVSLERARQKATEARSSIADRIDPIAARDATEASAKAAAAAQAARLTLLGLFELWHSKEASKRKDRGAEIRRAFEKDVLPGIGGLYADEITRRHVMHVLDAVKDRGARRYANQLLQYLRQMFRFAAIREIVSGDPTFGLTRKEVGGQEHERDRYLTESELRALSRQLPSAGCYPGPETSSCLSQRASATY